MNIPIATYRIQFHHGFTFHDLENIIDYLNDLGISTIYASPVLTATPGSMHGYDGTDPLQVNPEIGTIEQWQKITARLKAHKMQWLQDIVPNHMAFSPHNPRLMDVFERGTASPYYRYFDIIWNHHSPELKRKVMVPVLEEDLEKCIDKIKLVFSEKGFRIQYGEMSYPVSLTALDILLRNAKSLALYEDIIELKKISDETGPLAEWQRRSIDWVSQVNRYPEKVAEINNLIVTLQADKPKYISFLGAQHYRLMNWKLSGTMINYRRFFTVNELICLRMEEDFTFSEFHWLLSELYKDGFIQGIRIDHIDGLCDPAGYCEKVRKLFGDDCYIIAEKILAAAETLPAQWPIQGTTGYEFLAEVNQLFTHRSGAAKLSEYYKALIPGQISYESLVSGNKKLILENSMAGEWDNLFHYLYKLQLDGGFDRDKLKAGLGALLISLPVYRLYPEKLPLTGKNLSLLYDAFEKAFLLEPSAHEEILYLRSLFTDQETRSFQKSVLLFLQRLMQFTGPLTAKGVEDTTFYSYNPLISHDEVGESPTLMTITVQQFHQKMLDRSHSFPLSLNTTSTHDTKRGEDARLRLNVLSEIPDKWIALVGKWITAHKSMITEVSTGSAPTLNDQYFIYQSVIGGFPPDLSASPGWIARLQEYIIKVLREGKVNSDWSDPKKEYEDACTSFVAKLFSSEDFTSELVPFIEIVDAYAMTYSLALIVLKSTGPGIPDIYQGVELWSHHFVDPDNRREVDYGLRKTMLTQIADKEEEGTTPLMTYLRRNRASGLEKIYVTKKILNFRKENEAVFTQGEYVPLLVTAPGYAIAYARVFNGHWVIVVAPIRLSKNETSEEPSSKIMFPENLAIRLTNIFTGEIFEGTENLYVNQILKIFPVAVLEGRIN